jgi:hypothetical protein
VAAETIEEVRLSCLTNAYYHGSREAFLDTVHRWLMFGVIACGAGSIAELLPSDPQSPWSWLRAGAAACAAAFGALDLAFDLSNRARVHAMMKRRYYELAGELREGKKLDARECRVCLDKYSAEEEPLYRALFLASWNRAQREIYGQQADQFRINLFFRAIKNFWRLPSIDFGEPQRAGTRGILREFWARWKTWWWDHLFTTDAPDETNSSVDDTKAGKPLDPATDAHTRGSR